MALLILPRFLISVQWTLCYVGIIFIFFSCCFSLYLNGNEISMVKKERKDTIESSSSACTFIENRLPDYEENITLNQKFKSSRRIIKKFFKNQSNILWGVNFCLSENLYLAWLLWYPYYFIASGMGVASSSLATSLSFGFILGTYCYEIVVSYYPSSRIQLNFIFCFISALIQLSVLFVPTGQDRYLEFFALLFLLSMLSSGPISEIFSQEMKLRGGSDK